MRTAARHMVVYTVMILFLAGCVGTRPREGKDPQGRPVYLGSMPRTGDDAFQNYLATGQKEIHKIHYFLERLRGAKDLIYIRDGQEYSWTQAYRGAKWLISNRYEPGEDLRGFARDHIWLSENSGKPHYIRYPDQATGLQVGYYVLLNELDWLERAAAKIRSRGNGHPPPSSRTADALPESAEKPA